MIHTLFKHKRFITIKRVIFFLDEKNMNEGSKV